MIAENFKPQIDYLPKLTNEVLERAEFKTVWSGKRLQEGDRVLQAYVYVVGTDDLKSISFVERELHELDTRFNFIAMEQDIIPVLSFKEDTKIRK